MDLYKELCAIAGADAVAEAVYNEAVSLNFAPCRGAL